MTQANSGVGAQWDARFGYGIATPYATIKIDN